MAAELLDDKTIGYAKPMDKQYTLRDGNGFNNKASHLDWNLQNKNQKYDGELFYLEI